MKWLFFLMSHTLFFDQIIWTSGLKKMICLKMQLQWLKNIYMVEIVAVQIFFLFKVNAFEQFLHKCLYCLRTSSIFAISDNNLGVIVINSLWRYTVQKLVSHKKKIYFFLNTHEHLDEFGPNHQVHLIVHISLDR